MHEVHFRPQIAGASRGGGYTKRKAESKENNIKSILSEEYAKTILEQINTNTQRVFKTTMERQNQKFEQLLERKTISESIWTPKVDQTKWVINLSSRTLMINDAETA